MVPGTAPAEWVRAAMQLFETVALLKPARAAALGVGHAPTDSPEVRRVALGFDERVPEAFKNNLRLSRTGH